ncbi:MAG TPA: hypothetical protein P5084_08035 [Paludibacter sp.]|nr:hypothetical protein [Paludibacter sp.]
MLENLKRYVFIKRATKFINTNLRDRRFVNYEKAKSILILFESDYSEKNILVRRIIRNLVNDGKKVSAWGYIEKKEITTAILPDFRVLHQKDTDFFQKPKVSFFNELEDMEFDLLIDLTVNEVLPLQYIAIHANALCKTGSIKNELEVYDFAINLENINSNDEEEPMDINARYIFDQIIFYLKSIQTKD